MKALFLALQTFQDTITNQRVTTMCDDNMVVARATSPLDGSPQRTPGSEIPPGTIEHPRGAPQPPQPSTSGGMVPAPTISEDDHPHLEVPDNRLIRNTLQWEASLYCSLIPDPQAVFEDAFRHPWKNLDVYAFPPFHLVKRVVARVRETPNLSMTLIAPLWPEKSWFADLLLLLTLPPWDRLLRQPHFHRFHGGVHALNLHSWRLSSVSSESQDFRDELRASCPDVSESPLHTCTSRNGSPSVVGVVEVALLRSTPLYP